MRLQRAREGGIRAEMQFIKWAAEGADQNSADGRVSILRRVTSVILLSMLRYR